MASKFALAAAALAPGLASAQSVYGGTASSTSGVFATVAGGYANTADDYYTSIIGGYGNDATGPFATVGGGGFNDASGALATIGGGQINVADGQAAVVGGGVGNTASVFSTVGGGLYNEADNYFATVTGGLYNTASGFSSSVAGGRSNTASGLRSFAGGHAARATHTESGVLGFNAGVSAACTSQGPNTFHVCASGGFFVNGDSCCYDDSALQNTVSELQNQVSTLLEIVAELQATVGDCCATTTEPPTTTTPTTTTTTTEFSCNCGELCPAPPGVFNGWCNINEDGCVAIPPLCDTTTTTTTDGDISTTSTSCECGAECYDDDGNLIGWYQPDCTCLDNPQPDCDGTTSTTTNDVDTTTTTDDVDTTTTTTACPCGNPCIYIDPASGAELDGRCDASGGCVYGVGINCDSTTTTLVHDTTSCECGAECYDAAGNLIGWYQPDCTCFDNPQPDCDSTTTTSSDECLCGEPCVFVNPVTGETEDGKCNGAGNCVNTGPIDCDSTTTTSSDECLCGEPCVFVDPVTGVTEDGKCNGAGNCVNTGPIDCDSTTTTSSDECLCGEPCVFVNPVTGETEGGKCNGAGNCVNTGTIDCDSTTTTAVHDTTSCECGAECLDADGNLIGWYQPDCTCYDNPQPNCDGTTSTTVTTLEDTTSTLPAKVTCILTMDNYLNGFWIDGVDMMSQTTSSCANNWLYECTVTFDDTSMSPSGQSLALFGDEASNYGSTYNYCSRSGFALTCSSEDPDSLWNDVRSDTSDAWSSYSSMTPLATTDWAVNPLFDDSSWLDPVVSTSGFYCTACGNNGNGDPHIKIWGAQCKDYSYFRRTVVTPPTAVAPPVAAAAGSPSSPEEVVSASGGSSADNNDSTPSVWVYVLLGVAGVVIVALVVVIVVLKQRVTIASGMAKTAAPRAEDSEDTEEEEEEEHFTAADELENAAPATKSMVAELTSVVDRLGDGM